MTDEPMRPEEERAFYANPDNQTVHGPPRRRIRGHETVAIEFCPELMSRVRAAADAAGVSVHDWVRHAVDRELDGR